MQIKAKFLRIYFSIPVPKNLVFSLTLHVHKRVYLQGKTTQLHKLAIGQPSSTFLNCHFNDCRNILHANTDSLKISM